VTLSLADSLPRLTGAVRIDVFATREVTIGRRRKPTTVCVGWQGWNADPIMADRMARLPGSGSFYWPGAIRALTAAKRLLREDETIHQIKIETISGQEIARVYR
jgi:hypothetical protein